MVLPAGDALCDHNKLLLHSPPITKPPIQVVPGTLEDNITLIVDADWKGAEVRAPVGVNFAVRLIGGGSITPNVTKGSLLVRVRVVRVVLTLKELKEHYV